MRAWERSTRTGVNEIAILVAIDGSSIRLWLWLCFWMKYSEVRVVSFDGSEIDTRAGFARLMDLLGVFSEDVLEEAEFRGIGVVGAVGAAGTEVAEPVV